MGCLLTEDSAEILLAIYACKNAPARKMTAFSILGLWCLLEPICTLVEELCIYFDALSYAL